MSKTKYGKPQRIDPEFEKDMREIAETRVKKGLAKLDPKEVSLSEMTRLLRRTVNYKFCLDELKTKPKKENVPSQD